MANTQRKPVSFESEQLILVDADDRPLGSGSKAWCHTGDGVLHRAFSLFIFNPAGKLLLQQRSTQKRLWPKYWSNSCCSHPRLGESMAEATQRRLEQELGMQSQLEFLYKFSYHAHYLDLGAEREVCSVYIGASADPVQANADEIADWRFISAERLSAEINSNPGQFTPWFMLEWEHLNREFRHELRAVQAHRVALT